MGDRKRFFEAGRLIRFYFPKEKFRNIADIAGGTGKLQIVLSDYNITTFDKKRNRRKREKNINFKNTYFSEKENDNFDLLVGIHPDEATDIILTESLKRRIPFFIIPCCVLPTTTQFNNKNRDIKKWIEHLIRIAENSSFEVIQRKLNFNGANIALIGKPKN